LPGLRDEDALAVAPARPRRRWSYAQLPDLALLAAAYAHGIARAHPYNDGNNRVAFVAAATLLGLNGHELDASDAQVLRSCSRSPRAG